MFWLYSFPSTTPSRPSANHLSHSISCLLSLISNNQKKNENQNKQTRINKIPTMQKKKTKDNERHTKKKPHGVYFMLAKHSFARNLPWSVVDILSDTLLEKTDFFPFLEGTYKLPTASELGVRLFVHFPSPWWDFVWFEPVAGLMHAITVSVSSYVQKIWNRERTFLIKL